MSEPTLVESAVLDGNNAAEVVRDATALSYSGAKRMLSSPAKYRWHKDHPTKPTADMELGTAVHTALFGVGQTVEVSREWGDFKTKAAQQWRDEVRANGGIPLLGHDADTVAAMVAAIRAHPDAGPLVAEGTGVPERGLLWTDPTTGVPCKALVDWTADNGRYMLDLKTCPSAAPGGLPRYVANLGYGIQGRWYLEGGRHHGLVDENAVFLWVFVEREEPHLVTVARLSRRDLERAAEPCRLAREMWRDCMASGLWPGYPTGIHEISLPDWAWRQYEEDDKW